MNGFNLETEIKSFAHLTRQLGATEAGPDIYVLKPKKAAQASSNKSIALTLGAVIHGNEVAGIAVLNNLLAQLIYGSFELRCTLAVYLGNVPAAHADLRFRERDLNRSFGRTGTQTWEERRALELTKVLGDTAFFVDFHQTIQPSERAFCIFPHHPKSYRFARSIWPEGTIITHWGKPFSAEGMCTDEFVTKNGGAGITVESGQKGFDSYQIGLGTQIALRALAYVQAPDVASVPARATGPLFTYAENIPYPDVAGPLLDPGWTNFKAVQAGQHVGTAFGKPLVAPRSGMMLFPKYITDPSATRPTELYRIIAPIQEADLPLSDPISRSTAG